MARDITDNGMDEIREASSEGGDLPSVEPNSSHEREERSMLGIGGLTAALRDAASTDLRTLDEMPGAEVSAMSGMNHEFQRLPQDWRAMSVVVEGVGSKKHEEAILNLIKTRKGAMLGIFPRFDNVMDLCTVFPNRELAEASLRDICTYARANSLSIKNAGIQSKGIIYGSIIKETPVFFGSGIDSSRESLDLNGLSGTQPTEASLWGTMEDTIVSRIAKELTKPNESHAGYGAVALVDIPNYGWKDTEENAPEKRAKLLRALESIVDRSSDTITLIGNQILITSVAEHADRKLAARLSKIFKENPGVQMTVRLQEGEIDLAELGESLRTRVLRGTVFETIKTIDNRKAEDRNGIFVLADTCESIAGAFRGANVIREDLDGGETYKLVSVEERTSEIITGGPSELIGREEIMGRIEKLREETESETGSNHIIVVEGPPGIGKSRILEEIAKSISALNESEENRASLTQTVAQQYEATKSYVFISNFIKNLLGQNKKLENTGSYRMLEEMTEGSPESIGMFANPKMLAELIIKFISENGKNLNVLMFDDLQWCDNESATVIAFILSELDNSPKNDHILTMLASRSGKQTMPSRIQQALEGTKAYTAEVAPLPFEEDRELLEKYFSKTFRRKVNVKSVPGKFWEEISQRVQGNPYALYFALINMESRGAIQIEDDGFVKIKDGISYDDFAGKGLFSSMINACSKKEKEVLSALKLFQGCRVNETVFRKLFRGLSSYLEDLIDVGLIVRDKGYLRLQHDILREAVEERFRAIDGLGQAVLDEKTFEIYQLIDGDPNLRKLLTPEEKFSLIRPLLESTDFAESSERPTGDLAKAVIENGVEAVKQYSRRFGYAEMKDVLELILSKKIPEIEGDDNLKKTILELLCKACMGLGDGESMEKYLQELSKNPLVRADQSAMTELRMDFCDACYIQEVPLQAGSAKLDAAILELERTIQGLDQFLRPIPEHIVELNRIRSSYMRKQYGEAIRMCNSLLRNVRKDLGIGRNIDSTIEADIEELKRKPIDLVSLFLELERLYVKMRTEAETLRRSSIDSDAVFGINPPAATKGELTDLHDRSARLLQYYRGLPIMKNPKDILAAGLNHERLLGILGDSEIKIYRGNSEMRVFAGERQAVTPTTTARKEFFLTADEAARNAELFGDREQAGLMRKLIGDMILSSTNLTLEDVNKALEQYRVGAAILDAGRGAPRHRIYPFLSASIAKAVAMKGMFFQKTQSEEFKRNLEIGWAGALEYYNGCMERGLWKLAARDVIPIMAELRRLGAIQGLKFEIPMSRKMIGDREHGEIEEALTATKDSLDPQTQSAERTWIERKIEWVGSLTVDQYDLMKYNEEKEARGR